MSSNFQMTFPDKLSDIPPLHETASDRRWSLHWSMSSMRAHSKQMAELGKVFRWSAQLGQIVRWSTQISSQIYPPIFRWSAQMKCTLRPKPKMRKWVPIFRWCVQISCQIYPPPVSDEVHTETQTQNEEMSSYFQMACPDKVSDIPPNWAWISGRPLHCLIFMTDWPHSLLQLTTDAWQTATLMDTPH